MSKQNNVTVNPENMEETTMNNNYYDENETQANDIQEETTGEVVTIPEEQATEVTPKKKFGVKEFLLGMAVGVPAGIVVTCGFFAFKGKKAPKLPENLTDNIVEFAKGAIEQKAKEA